MVKIKNVWFFQVFFKDWSKEHTAIRVKILRQKYSWHVLADSLWISILVVTLFADFSFPVASLMTAMFGRNKQLIRNLNILLRSHSTQSSSWSRNKTERRWPVTNIRVTASLPRNAACRSMWRDSTSAMLVPFAGSGGKKRGWGGSLMVVTTVTLSFENIRWKFQVWTRRRRYGNLVRLVFFFCVQKGQRDGKGGDNIWQHRTLISVLQLMSMTK